MEQSKFAEIMREMQMSSSTTLPAKSLMILQIDGKAFRTWTKGLAAPYDYNFTTAMDNVAKVLAKHISGVEFGYVQSDEINLLVTDLRNLQAQQYYGGRVQKIVSTSAGLASSVLTSVFPEKNYAVFDARAFIAPDMDAVKDWFVFRQGDAIKNSVRQVAHSQFSHKQLHGKNTPEVKKMLQEAGNPWESYPEGVKVGRLISKVHRPATKLIVDKRTKQEHRAFYVESAWESSDAPIFRDSEMFDKLKVDLKNL